MSIEATTLFDVETMSRAREWHWKSYGVARWLLPAGGVLFIAAGLMLYQWKGRSDGITFLLVVYGIWLLVRKQVLRRQFQRSIRSSPQRGKELKWVFDESH